ncbi:MULTISPECIES: chemotaxis protein CheB [unclassified Polaromonas]|uniref:chemotaxis protein CheB n=1 Tax=unclassified Polaromonas TaxID=2638319 RepID=UPI0018C9F14F|nr:MULTISPECIES: chemotaxis protein CheB [unclassified Polaromonas]MBG6070725.1 two-component system chemotaxis response regulator CheB [Polaromonas sp. CG_9.7]MBG6112967.1 two-component system chemotaxis response regulator CheB [Polaromonas sp. CG_9.2]MDH6186441.1 two-component system chemotaxis response regulator CheB [Polaromonas sp. CG_23.6]
MSSSADLPKRDIVVIGASAGGVEALRGFFHALPADLPAAFLVVLHIPADTASQLDRVLRASTRLAVKIAQDGEAISNGQVYVASADRHLMLTPQGIRLSRGPKEGRFRPSIDVLFRSAATAFGPRVIGVVLSGALDDGTAGLWAIKDHQGLALVQDPDEAMYSSMPQSAMAHVQVDLVGTLEALAAKVSELVGTTAPEAIPMTNTQLAMENHIAMEGNALRAGVMNLGKISKYTCPDCHGVLVQIEEGPIVRFRCHTGHAFSLKSLLAQVNEAIDNGLWATLRAVEERVMLLRQMQALAQESGAIEEAAEWCGQADQSEKRLQPLRELVLDPEFFGHTPGV